MTGWRKRQVIDMARESHMDVYGLGKDHDKFVFVLERFAELVRADERSECAKVCEEVGEESDSFTRDILRNTAAAIRARGQA